MHEVDNGVYAYALGAAGMLGEGVQRDVLEAEGPLPVGKVQILQHETELLWPPISTF